MAEAPSLNWLINPVSREEFFSEYWERRALVVHRSEPEYFSDLLNLDEVDRVLSTMGRRYPEVILKNASREVTARDYTTDGKTLDIARVSQLFAEGSTITLAYLDTVVPQLTRFCRRLESEFSCPFQTNIYLTPPAAQGARPHYDTHDVFVLQVAGSKSWTIFDTPVELPLAGQDFDAALHPIGAPTMHFELKAGDVAYVPRGMAHEARSTDNISLHITAGMLRYTWADLLLEFVASACLKDKELRRSLPVDFARSSFSPESAQEQIKILLERVLANGDIDGSFACFVDDFMASCPPLLRGQLTQATKLSQLTPNSLVGLRDTGIWTIRNEGEKLTIHCGDRIINFPAYAEGAVRFALNRPNFYLRELPSSLDDAGKITLVRRLIQEGLLTVLTF